MLLATDIGNSSINIGFFIDGKPIVRKLDSFPERLSSEYLEVFKGFLAQNGIDKRPTGCIISSVVPGLASSVLEAARMITGNEPLIMSASLAEKFFTLDVDAPDEVGPDRIASSLGAYELFGAPCAVIDFGTATTVNFVFKGGVFKGGAIMPGLGLMRDSLSGRTARLPNVELRPAQSALGRNTEDAILSGVLCGTAGAVEGIISSVEKQEGVRFKVAITGGYSALMAGHMSRLDFHEPDLTLIGLKKTYDKVVHART